jgi:hypothetical protein
MHTLLEIHILPLWSVMLKWDLQCSFSGQKSVLISDIPMNSTCLLHLTHLNSVTMRLSTEQYMSLLQFSTLPNDSKHQQIKKCTHAV